MKTRMLLPVIFGLLMFGILFAGPQTANAADGSAGEIEVGTTSYVVGQSLTVYLKDMTVSGDYSLSFTTGCHDQINFTLGADQDAITFVVVLDAPTSGSTCTITLEAQSTGTDIDTVTLVANDPEDLFPTDMIIDIAIIVLVISIIVGIAVAFRYKKM